MSIKINTSLEQVISSRLLNEKVDSMFGGNVVIYGLDVSRVSNTQVAISPGKCIINGTSIEEDENTINVNIPSNLLSEQNLYTVMEYTHETNSVEYKVVSTVLKNMLELAKITMINSTIDNIINAEKTCQLNELSEIAKDLETGLFNTQHLEVAGESIVLTDGYRSKTDDMKLEGNTKQNLIQTPGKETVISGEYFADADYSHNFRDTKDGVIDTVIQGNTIQNLIKSTENKEVATSGLLNLGSAYEHKIDDSKAGFVDFSVKGRTIKNLMSGIGATSSASLSGDVCTMQSLESGYAIAEIIPHHNLKADTEYTIIINILEVTDVKFLLDMFDTQHLWRANVTTLSKTGLQRFKFTTPCEITKFKVQLQNNPGNLIKFNKNMLILEGDYTTSSLNIDSYINGIQGVGEKSKNLFNGILEIGGISGANGVNEDTSTRLRTDFIEISNTIISTKSYEENLDVRLYYFYDSQKQFMHSNAANNTDLYSVTVPSNTKYIRVVFANKDLNYNFSHSNYTNIQIQEGSAPTEYQPCNTYKVEVLSHGKNLWDLKNSVPGFIEGNYGNLSSPDCQNRTSDFIRIKPNTIYTYMTTVDVSSSSHPESWNAIAWYDENKNYITRNVETGNTMGVDTVIRTLQSPSNARYVRVGSRYLESDSSKVTFSEGVISEHIPYEGYKAKFFLDKPLHYLDSKAYDEITADGQLIRRVEQITFDGSEQGWSRESQNDTHVLFSYNRSSLPVNVDIMMCDTFDNVQSLWLTIENGEQKEGIDIAGSEGSRHIKISIKKSRLASSSVSSFTDWLKTNPVTVLHQAAESTITLVGVPKVETFNGVTHIKSSNTVNPKINIDSKGNKYPALLKPNTKYTVRWFSKSGDSNLDLDLGGAKLSVDRLLRIAKITTPQTLAHENLYVAGWDTTINDIAVIEGDKTILDTPYVIDIKSTGDKSKNLFNEQYLDGYVDDATGEFVENEDKSATDFIEVEPSTQYIVSKNGASQRTNVLCFDKDKKFIKKNESLEQPFETTENCKFIRMHWNKSTINNNHQVQLEKGTKVTSYAPHYKGYKVTVKSCSKNLFDINTLKVKNAQSYEVSGSRIDFVTTGNYGGFLFDHNNLVPGKTYTLSYKGHNSRVFVTYADGTYSHNAITAKDGVFIKSTFTIPENKKILYIQCENGNTGATSAWIDEIQIEESGEFSSYENYKEDVKEYFLDEPLRRLPNGVCDEITPDGELIRRVGKVVFDGSESEWWTYASHRNGESTLLFYIRERKAKESSHIICNQFSQSDYDPWNISFDRENTALNFNKDILIRILRSKVATEDLEGFRQYLKENPLEVYYELESSIKTQLNTTRLNTYNEATNILSTNCVNPKIQIDSKGQKYPALLLPKTKYTISAVLNGSDENIGIDLGGTKLTISKSQNQIEITTPSNLNHSNLYLSGWNVKASGVMVQQGDISNADSVYFQGIASVGEKSKNIMSSNLEYGTIYSLDGLPESVIRYDRKRTADFIKVEANKTYVYNTNVGESKVNWYAYDENKKFIKFLGYNNKIVTPYNCQYIKYHNGIPENYDLNLVYDQIEEGTMISDYVPYYSGYKIKIANTGKNLTKYADGYFENRESWCFLNGESNAYLTNLMRNKTRFLLRKGKYVFNYSDSSCKIQLCVGDEQRIYARKNIITLKEDTYCIFRVAANSDGVIQWSDLQLEKGINVSSFEPYKEFTKSIYLDEPLMKLPNGVRDEIVGNKLVRRVGKVVFNGSEGWIRQPSLDSETTSRYYTMLANTPKLTSYGLCDKMCYIRYGGDDVTNIYAHNTEERIDIRKHISDDRWNDVNSLKQWLSLNPVTIYYELKSSVIIDLSSDLNIRTHDGTNNIETSCIVKPKLSFKAANNLRAITRKVTERIVEAEKMIDEILLPNIVETDYERTLLEFDYNMEKYLL